MNKETINKMKQDNEKAHKINNPAFVEQKQILYYRLRNN